MIFLCLFKTTKKGLKRRLRYRMSDFSKPPLAETEKDRRRRSEEECAVVVWRKMVFCNIEPFSSQFRWLSGGPNIDISDNTIHLVLSY